MHLFICSLGFFQGQTSEGRTSDCFIGYSERNSQHSQQLGGWSRTAYSRPPWAITEKTKWGMMQVYNLSIREVEAGGLGRSLRPAWPTQSESEASLSYRRTFLKQIKQQTVSYSIKLTTNQINKHTIITLKLSERQVRWDLWTLRVSAYIPRTRQITTKEKSVLG